LSVSEWALYVTCYELNSGIGGFTKSSYVRRETVELHDREGNNNCSAPTFDKMK
jgi:hypothetical protein